MDLNTEKELVVGDFKFTITSNGKLRRNRTATVELVDGVVIHPFPNGVNIFYSNGSLTLAYSNNGPLIRCARKVEYLSIARYKKLFNLFLNKLSDSGVGGFFGVQVKYKSLATYNEAYQRKQIREQLPGVVWYDFVTHKNHYSPSIQEMYAFIAKQTKTIRDSFYPLSYVRQNILVEYHTLE